MITQLRCNQEFISRSKDIVDQYGSNSGIEKSLLGMYDILDTVSAYLILDESKASKRHLIRYVESIQYLLNTEGHARQEVNWPGFSDEFSHLDDASAKKYVALCDMAYVLVALDFQDLLSKIADQSDKIGIKDHLDPFIQYLAHIALGNVAKAGRERQSNWNDWLEEEVVFEQDNRWPVAIAIEKGDESEFISELQSWRNLFDRRLSNQRITPFVITFSDLVLGLEFASLICIARRRGFNFSEEVNTAYGFFYLSSI